MHLYTYLSRYSRNNNLLDVVGNEERAITNMEEELQFSGNLRRLIKRNKKERKSMHERIGERWWWWFVCLFFFLNLFIFSLQRERSSSLYARGECRYARHVLSPTYPSSLYFCPLYILICVRCIGNQTRSAYRKARGKKKPRETNPGI